MERPRGLEPPPTAWQAVVLPLYYGREKGRFCSRNFYSMRTTAEQEAATQSFAGCHYVPQNTALQAVRLIDFDDPGGLYDRRLFLSIGEARRSLPVDVNPRELLPVMVIHGDLPMTVFAAPVTSKS